jgi:hypothetical protein
MAAPTTFRWSTAVDCSPEEKAAKIKEINLGALTNKDDEADVIIEGPIKVETKTSKVSKFFFKK